MKLLRLLLVFSIFFLASPARAEVLEESTELEVELAEVQVIQSNIQANSSVEVNKSIIFDASKTVSTLPDSKLSYEWILGDGNRQTGAEVVHAYAEAGEYEVQLIVKDQFGNESTKSHQVFAYKSSFVLVSNVQEESLRIEKLVESARKEGIYVDTIVAYSKESDFLSEEALKRQIIEHIEELNSAKRILVWTRGTSGLTLFSQLKNSVEDPLFFKNKDIVFITDTEFTSLINVARGVYQSIHPNEIILIHPESIWVFAASSDIETFLVQMDERGEIYERITDKLKLRPWNLLSYLVNVMIERGVPSNTIQLILMLPVIVFIVAFMKQIVGLTTLGVYTPSVLALSFIALDLTYGLAFLLAILVIGTLSRLFLKRYRILYIPRMAIVLTIVSLSILVLMFFGAYFQIGNVVGIAVFPMLMMSTLVERFVAIQGEQGLKSALIVVGEAILVAVICTIVAEWPWLKGVMLGHPELILLFLILNVLLGRWTGLRVIEYYRFREIIRHAEE
jgi:hypothetical protein